MIGYENDEMIWIQLDPFSFNLFWKLRHNGKLLNRSNYNADAGRKIVQIVGKWALLIYYKKLCLIFNEFSITKKCNKWIKRERRYI